MPRPGPSVRLGETSDNGIAAAIYALVERGVEKRPGAAAMIIGRVQISPREGIDPVRIDFRGDQILVEDGAWENPDLLIDARLPDIVALTMTSTVAGMPNPFVKSGRAALGGVARGRVRIEGRRALGRQLLQVLRL